MVSYNLFSRISVGLPWRRLRDLRSRLRQRRMKETFVLENSWGSWQGAMHPTNEFFRCSSVPMSRAQRNPTEGSFVQIHTKRVQDILCSTVVDSTVLLYGTKSCKTTARLSLHRKLLFDAVDEADVETAHLKAY